MRLFQLLSVKVAFDTNAHDTSGEDSKGLWQINLNAHPEFLSWNLYDPQSNAFAAYQIYLKAGNSFRDWTCATKLGLLILL